MNGNGSGIVPTVDLATNNNGYAYPYPAYPMMGGYGYGNNGFGFGGDGIWAIVLVALLFGNGFGGWGGFGGFGGGLGIADGGLLGYAIGNNATKSDLSDGLFSVQNGAKLDNISTQISNGFSDNATNICNLRSDVLENRYANQLAECTTQRDILTQTNELNNNILAQTNELNTNLLTTQLNAQAQLDKCCCDLRAQGLENTQRILDVLNQNTIQDLRDRLQAAENRLSDDNVINTVLPRSVPAYITASPYQSIIPFGFGNGFWGNNWNYGNGFFGNTIV